MARKQTRRSISVSGPTYSQLKEYAESTGQTMSGITQGLIESFLANAPAPEVKSEPSKEPMPPLRFTEKGQEIDRKETIRQIMEKRKAAEGIFTF